MRPRSGGVHADSNEGFLKLALLSQSRDNRERRTSNGSKLLSHRISIIQSQISTSFYEDKAWESQNPISSRDNSCIAEFDYNGDNTEIKALQNSPSAIAVDNMMAETSSYLDKICAVEKPKIEKNYKIMVIGARNTGKHTLIDASFPEEKSNSQSLDNTNCLDLIIKRKEDILACTKYQFWINELSNNRYDSLIKVYYRTIQVFIFVYSINNKETFNKVDKAIAAVYDELPKKNFFAILIANKNDEKREIKYEDGLALKIKYGLDWFIETNRFIEADASQVIRKINELLKAKQEEDNIRNNKQKDNMEFFFDKYIYLQVLLLMKKTNILLVMKIYIIFSITGRFIALWNIRKGNFFK